MNYDCSLWHHHSSLQHTWCHAPMMSSPTEERWHHGWSEVPPEYFMGLVSEWGRWYLIIKRLMKVFLTLSFVLRLSNERVTDLMSHDAEEIWWGHPLNFSQWVLQVFLETVSSAFALLVRTCRSEGAKVSVKQSSVFFVFQTGRCDVVSSRVRASYLWDWRDAGTWKIPLMTNCPNSLNIS